MTTSLVPSVFDISLFIPDFRPKKKEAALHELAARAHAARAARDPELLAETLVLRERLAASGIGKGVAVPHARSIAVTEPRLVVARSRRGIEWGAADGLPIHLVLMALSPSELPEDVHHDFVARAVAVARLQRNRQKLLDAPSFEIAAAVLREVVP